MSCLYQYNVFTGNFDLVGEGGTSVVTPATVLTKAAVTIVPSGTDTTVLTYTALADTVLTNIFCSGTYYAKWTLRVNTVDEIVQRTGPDRNQPFQFTAPWKILSGDVIDVRVIHAYTGETADFEATIMGY